MTTHISVIAALARRLPTMDPAYRGPLGALLAELHASTRMPEPYDPDPRRCIGCGTALPSPALYCGELCEQEARFVRYVRRRLGDGGIIDRPVAEAVATQLLMLGAGGYPRRARTVPTSVREAVIARDGRRCLLCGASGEHIDHINGSSNAPENLRLLCAAHNAEAMRARVRVLSVDEDPDLVAFLIDQRERLAARVLADPPSRPCDDEKTWAQRWRGLRAARRR